MIIINESSYLAKIAKFHSNFTPSIKIVSTKGFLLDYNLKEDRVEYYVKDKALYAYLQTLKKSNKKIVIATDLDNAGHLIALELLSIFKENSVYRLNIPFDDLCFIKEVIDENYILSRCSDQFEYGKAQHYLYNRHFNKSLRAKKLKAIAYLKSRGISRIKLPKKIYKHV
jgi:hypothetical protein